MGANAVHMNIGMIDVDGHNFPNLALMKLSAWHKARGDTVEWWWGFGEYDRVYMSKVFDETYSLDIQEPLNAREIIKGGTGYGLDNHLPDDVEHIYPDYFGLYGEHDGTAALLLDDTLDTEGVERVIYRTGYNGLDIITSGMELYAADRALYDREDTDTARVLASVLDLVRNDYDFCIIDNGPSVDTVTLNVLSAADDVLIPIRPDEFSFSGLLDLVEQVQSVRENINPGLTLRGAFFTHWQRREAFIQARQSLEDSGICPVLKTEINYNPKVPESTLEEMPLCAFAPRSWAAIQYKKLTAEYLALTDSGKGKEG